MRAFLAAAFAILCCPHCPAQPVSVTPWTPTTADVIWANMYLGSCAPSARSYTVTATTVNVTLVNDGPSFNPNPPCLAGVNVGTLPVGGYTFVISVVDGYPSPPVTTIPVVVVASPGPVMRPAIEFYNASQNHYFISVNPVEIYDLDTGVHVGWSRTGQSFNTGADASTGGSPVCRYYMPPVVGDSHFFSVLAYECNYVQGAIISSYPSYLSQYVWESPNVFYMGIPDSVTGACPANSVPVYRLWNNQPSSNHRYTTSTVIKAQMVSEGWIPEGYGPNAVGMCAPS